MYLFFSSLSSATAHKASVSFSKGGREGVLEHNCGLWMSVVLLLAYWEVSVQSGFLSYLSPWPKVQGTRTSNCSWRPQFCPWWAVVEAAASGLAEHILLLLASPWESCFYTCHLQVNLILPKIHVLLILYKITNAWPKI